MEIIGRSRGETAGEKAVRAGECKQGMEPHDGRWSSSTIRDEAKPEGGGGFAGSIGKQRQTKRKSKLRKGQEIGQQQRGRRAGEKKGSRRKREKDFTNETRIGGGCTRNECSGLTHCLAESKRRGEAGQQSKNTLQSLVD